METGAQTRAVQSCGPAKRRGPVAPPSEDHVGRAPTQNPAQAPRGTFHDRSLHGLPRSHEVAREVLLRKRDAFERSIERAKCTRRIICAHTSNTAKPGDIPTREFGKGLIAGKHQKNSRSTNQEAVAVNQILPILPSARSSPLLCRNMRFRDAPSSRRRPLI